MENLVMMWFWITACAVWIAGPALIAVGIKAWRKHKKLDVAQNKEYIYGIVPVEQCVGHPMAPEKTMEGDKKEKYNSPPPPRTCPYSCESYHRGRVGVRACLAGRWDERDYHNKPLLRADTLEPVIPPECGILKGDALLADIFDKARKRRWR